MKIEHLIFGVTVLALSAVPATTAVASPIMYTESRSRLGYAEWRRL